MGVCFSNGWGEAVTITVTVTVTDLVEYSPR